LFIFIGNLIGGSTGALVAFLIALILNFASYWFSDRIVLSVYQAKEIGIKELPQIQAIVENLAKKMSIPKPRIYMIRNPSANAFATGRSPKFASVALTEGIITMLNKEEIEAVLCHELTHIKNRDTLVMTIAATLAGAITFIARMAGFSAFSGSRDNDRGGNALTLIAAFILAPIAALLIQMAISRSREYMADEGAAIGTGKPLNLASALKKLTESGKKMPMAAEPSSAHIFIVNPLAAGSFLLGLFSTHPPIEKRIEKLEFLAHGN